jgi:hypothetical protein
VFCIPSIADCPELANGDLVTRRDTTRKPCHPNRASVSVGVEDGVTAQEWRLPPPGVRLGANSASTDQNGATLVALPNFWRPVRNWYCEKPSTCTWNQSAPVDAANRQTTVAPDWAEVCEVPLSGEDRPFTGRDGARHYIEAPLLGNRRVIGHCRKSRSDFSSALTAVIRLRSAGVQPSFDSVDDSSERSLAPAFPERIRTVSRTTSSSIMRIGRGQNVAGSVGDEFAPYSAVIGAEVRWRLANRHVRLRANR